MLQLAYLSLLWAAAVACIVIGGVYFAFSAFVMRALGRIDQVAGVAAMQAINDIIQRSWFMPLFFGTSAASAVLAILALMQDPSAGAWLTLLAAGVHLIGMFGVTLVFNVPMNNRLALAKGGFSQTTLVWGSYLRDWTRWNHVRTIASIAAGMLYLAVLFKYA